MPRVSRTLVTKLPTYKNDRSQWRRDILEKVRKVAQLKGVKYQPDDRLEVVVMLYLKKGKRYAIHDVDNRLKDILDALQGRFGSPRTQRKDYVLIANDRQICRVLIEKQPTPKLFSGNATDAGGKLLIRPYEPCRWPLQVTKSGPLRRLHKRSK